MNVSCCSLSSQVLSQNARDRLKFTLKARLGDLRSEGLGSLVYSLVSHLFVAKTNSLYFSFLGAGGQQEAQD